jgi:tRNA threonylcarbamoyladenosine biosynthesis protein TsaB
MHTILAIESSTQLCSLALATPSGVFEHRISQAQQHSAQLLPAIAALLAQAGCAKPDLIAVAIGPGAFTSLRVAVGTAQGLALGWACPVVAVDTLAALAQQARRTLGLAAPCTVTAVLDARMGEAYCGSYALTAAGLHCVVPPYLAAYEALPPVKADCVVGNAGTLMPHWFSWGVGHMDAAPLAIDVLAFAQEGLANGTLHPMDAALLQPAYVRDQVALTEVQRGVASV